MAQNNLLQGYSWETQYEDSQAQLPRSIQDEVISVYEVYVKEETIGPDGRSEVSVVSGIPGSNEHQLIQADCLDLDAAIDSEVINIDGTVTKLLGKDSLKYKILEQSVTTPDDSVVVYSHPVAEGPSSTTPRLIDKDDPRSRLHFVKYLKRDGKTLKIWECGICSKEFRHQYTLMRHLPTHTDERNFKCEACGKAFRQLSTLSQHKAIHSDARPYVCEFCKKTFNRVSTLISHRKTHSEHKPHKCHLCGKGFHQKGNLRNHVFTHTNERPYKCELCGKGFNQMSNLVCHKVKAHAHAEKMQYVCGICGKEFPRRFSLRSHEEYKHGIKYRQTAGAQSTLNEPTIMRNKNVRIVHLPDGEQETMTEVSDKDPMGSGDYMESVLVDRIETKALENAILQGHTPFALFKPAKGIPVLVKVSPTAGQKHVLTPATAEDLRIAGKMTLSPTLNGDGDGMKAVQIKVPVVATVTQKIEPDGKVSFLVEAPGPDQEQESLVAPLDPQFPFEEPIRSDPERLNQSIQTPAPEDCNELLELAAQGGIQFVRATEDGRYEVMTNSEARDLMAQNSHDVTILNSEEANAINVVGIRGNVHDEVMGNTGNEIMVLDSESNQKSIAMDRIEILEDKDIRILDSKTLDDRYVDGITYLSQSKIDDLILGPKSLGMDPGVSVMEHDDDVGIGPCHQNLANILNHRPEMPNMAANAPTTMTSLLSKSQSSISILNESLPFFKNSHILSEDMNILADVGCPMDQQSVVDYESRMKLTEFDDGECDTGLIPISQSEVKILGSWNKNFKILGSNEKNQQKSFLEIGEVKILGPKNSEMTPQYQDLKFLGNYEQFLRNTGHNGFVNSGGGETRKEVKILGKKLETAILSTDDGNVVKVFDEIKKLTTPGSDSRNSCETVVHESSEEERSNSERASRDFLLQACSPEQDFLNFGNRLTDRHTSPGNFQRSHKDSDFVMTGLPDLD
ncbi:uncharacterized protein LOC105702671 [Orussus abietinus]|uniref:uncharacterized protein LOC105702671 n=1 Tax=Orussus abietinus TaxID=222816 RepID=UPI0006251DE3|nr:uncharacterized protein LOC105702671 [Orussus abietinus]